MKIENPSLPPSVPTKSQFEIYGPRSVKGYGPGAMLTVTVRYDDACGNGHNTFSITGEVVTPASKRRHDIEAGGCLHEEIARVFPEMAPFIKWHLCYSDGPLHYVENTAYWAGQRGWCDGKPGDPPNLAHARSAAIWPDASDADLTAPGLEERLAARLPALLVEFRTAVESLGFVY